MLFAAAAPLLGEAPAQRADHVGRAVVYVDTGAPQGEGAAATPLVRLVLTFLAERGL